MGIFGYKCLKIAVNKGVLQRGWVLPPLEKGIEGDLRCLLHDAPKNLPPAPSLTLSLFRKEGGASLHAR
jgi:hypothetical protein